MTGTDRTRCAKCNDASEILTEQVGEGNNLGDLMSGDFEGGDEFGARDDMFGKTG